MQIKILSLNVWDVPFWFSVKRHERLKRLGKYLKRINADIICLQEAFDVKHREDLHNLLGKNLYGVSATSDKSRRVLLFKRFDLTGGLVTYSKFPILESTFHPYRRFVDMMFAEYIGRKGALRTLVQTPKGPLLMMNTHFHTGTLSVDRHIRAKQLKQLFRAAEAPGTLPTVVAGDLNDNEIMNHKDYAPVLKKYRFRDAAENFKEAAKPTVRLGNRYASKTWFNRSRISKRLDYILVKNLEAAGLAVTEYKILTQPTDPFSDHDPVLVTIEAE